MPSDKGLEPPECIALLPSSPLESIIDQHAVLLAVHETAMWSPGAGQGPLPESPNLIAKARLGRRRLTIIRTPRLKGLHSLLQLLVLCRH